METTKIRLEQREKVNTSEHRWSDSVLEAEAEGYAQLAEIEEMFGRPDQADECRRLHAWLETLDHCDKLIAAARESGLNDAKPFALTDPLKAGTTTYVQGPDWVWKLEPLERFLQRIPPQALRAVGWVKAHGMATQGMWVAAPIELDPSVVTPGPVLTTTGAELLMAAGRRTWAGTKKAARTTAPVVAVAGLALALAPLAALTLLANDPVLVTQITLAPGGKESGTAVMVELARWV